MKGVFVLAIIFSCILIINNAEYVKGEELVCGHEPDSAKGYGQIIVHGVTLSCNNIADDLCPEEFLDEDGNEVSCSSCIDPDCYGSVYGIITDETNAIVQGATVTAHPVKWNKNATLEVSTLTNNDGLFLFNESVPTGTYFFSASKDSYDTTLKSFTVQLNDMQYLEIQMVNGTCHDDCTNSYGRCSSACHGKNFSTTTGVRNCSFYDANAINLCNNRLKGTSVFYNSYNLTHAYFIDCCEGTPQLKYYANAGANIIAPKKDVVTIEKIVNYNEQPVIMKIAFWK